MTEPASVEPDEILEFWFADAATSPERADQRAGLWFSPDAELDATIRRRFARICAGAAANALESWTSEPRPALALILLLDQFPRNLHRGTPEAFAQDPKALQWASRGVAAYHLTRLHPVEQAFYLMPYQHSEELDVQRESVRRLEELATAAAPAWRKRMLGFLDFARRHLEIIERFGRFPHRNEILGRDSTEAERRHLAGGGESFGQTALRGPRS